MKVFKIKGISVFGGFGRAKNRLKVRIFVALEGLKRAKIG